MLTIALALPLWIALMVAVGLPLVLTRLLSREALAALARPSHPVAFFLANGFVFAVLAAAFVISIRLLHGKRATDIPGEWRWTRFAAGFGVWTVCLGAMTLADVLIRPGGFRWTASGATGAMAAAALVGLGVQTFAEEFIFRGYLTQGLLLATRRPLPAAILSGLAFGALHIPNGIPQCVNAVVFGVVAALIAIRTGGIAFTWGMHLINNLFGAVVVVSAGDVFKGVPGLITQSTPGLMWWDTALGVILLAVPAWIVLAPKRNRPDAA